MTRVTDTEKAGERGWTLGVNPGAIEAMEEEGQRELCSEPWQLPVDGIGEVSKEFGIAYQTTEDPLFVDVTLPEGWGIVADLDHAMWSTLVDADGAKRARIFYKAAYYDRSARVYVMEAT